HAMACAAGGSDNDGAIDRAVSLKDRVLMLQNEKNGVFKDVTDNAGIKNEGPNVGVTFIDYDHDGDLDLYVTSTLKNSPAPMPGKDITFPSGLEFPGNFMWRNNGNGTFTNVTQDLEIYLDPSVSAIGTDYNNDRAVDLVVTNLKGPAILENPREGKFRDKSLSELQAPDLSLAISVLDFNHDGWMDLAFTHSTAPGLTLWRNDKGKRFERVTLPATNWARAFGLAAFDYDNDGWV